MLEYPELEDGGVIYRKEPLHDPLSMRDILDLEITWEAVRDFKLRDVLTWNETNTLAILERKGFPAQMIKYAKQYLAQLIAAKKIPQLPKENLKPISAYSLLGFQPSIEQAI